MGTSGNVRCSGSNRIEMKCAGLKSNISQMVLFPNAADLASGHTGLQVMVASDLVNTGTSSAPRSCAISYKALVRSPTLSAMAAPRVPSGLGVPSVLSMAV